MSTFESQEPVNALPQRDCADVFKVLEIERLSRRVRGIHKGLYKTKTGGSKSERFEDATFTALGVKEGVGWGWRGGRGTCPGTHVTSRDWKGHRKKFSLISRRKRALLTPSFSQLRPPELQDNKFVLFSVSKFVAIC